jgi:hypothetical protein
MRDRRRRQPGSGIAASNCVTLALMKPTSRVRADLPRKLRVRGGERVVLNDSAARQMAA